MSVEGMWCLVIDDAQGNGMVNGGVLVLETGRLFGGDSFMASRTWRRRLPDRGQVADGGDHGSRPSIRRGQRLRCGSGIAHGPDPDDA